MTEIPEIEAFSKTGNPSVPPKAAPTDPVRAKTQGLSADELIIKARKHNPLHEIEIR